MLAIVLVVGPLLVVRFAPHARPVPKVRVAQRIVPKTELPPVEPVELQAVTPEDAKAFNDTVPFSTAPNPPARPFVFSGDSNARARAIDCLAVGVLYEAGDDTDGERAVAQVILNRVRHPAFPKSVCGVVFQGSERSTGCQFSFACDGAMSRWRPNPAAWTRARAVAVAALNGSVYGAVGYATHYHTDWVVPYWSASLDKVTAVKTHLFFRWTGWWGTPAAFVRSVSGFEPGIAALDGFSAAHSGAAAVNAEVNPAEIDAATLNDGSEGPGATSIDPNSFLVTLDPNASADSVPASRRQGLRHARLLQADGVDRQSTDAQSAAARSGADFDDGVQLSARQGAELREGAVELRPVQARVEGRMHEAAGSRNAGGELAADRDEAGSDRVRHAEHDAACGYLLAQTRCAGRPRWCAAQGAAQAGRDADAGKAVKFPSLPGRGASTTQPRTSPAATPSSLPPRPRSCAATHPHRA
ncbi:cell wall hydrolase [Sphingomonas panacisoli]|uniref:cell wall hydrolase n=1 Tax=Sphingomonas panacisoli TaxID=1813879 RepID=UPI001F00FB90|nr:cell wall hydrolase [Sphingomonas panacisoli]